VRWEKEKNWAFDQDFVVDPREEIGKEGAEVGMSMGIHGYG